jgi:signal transduction histidine kinase
MRTPLTALRGELENAVDQARLLPELQDKVGSALEEVDRLAKIVQTLFAISRLDAGEAQEEWRRFDLARLAADTAGQMSLLAEDKGISVKCSVGEEAGVEGDRARIKQVVVNLLDNAIKYTPQGGAIRLNVHARGGKAVMEVVDTGIGIPAVALPHVFERFFRVDKGRSRDIGGAGLGLAIVKSICTAHGGQVEVQSTEGRGSRFIVELPLAETAGSRTDV